MESPDNRREADDSCWGARRRQEVMLSLNVFSSKIDQFTPPATDAKFSIETAHQLDLPMRK